MQFARIVARHWAPSTGTQEPTENIKLCMDLTTKNVDAKYATTKEDCDQPAHHAYANYACTACACCEVALTVPTENQSLNTHALNACIVLQLDT